MAVMTNPLNPRQVRAFAQAANFEAKHNPSKENVSRMLAYQEHTRKGPKKSRELGASALSKIEDTHVFHVDWTVTSQEGVGNFGGKIISKRIAERLALETAQNASAKDKKYDAWGAAITSGASWVSGSAQPTEVKFNSFLSPSEAIKLNSNVTFGWDGEPLEISAERTIIGALERVMAEAPEDKTS